MRRTPGPFIKPTSLPRASLLIAVIGLATKITGFLRITALTIHLGAIRPTDAFLTAFLIPETLYLFLTEGAVTSAFVPVFTRYALRSPDSFRRLLIQSSAIALVLASTLAALIGYGGHRIVYLVAPGFDSATVDSTRNLLQIILPYIPLTLMGAILTAASNAVGHYVSPALGPLLFNLCVIGSVPFSSPDHLSPLAWGVVVGGLAQLLVQMPYMVTTLQRHQEKENPEDPIDPENPNGSIGPEHSARSDLPPERVLDEIPPTRIHPGIREMTHLAIPLALTTAMIQFQILAERTIASTLEGGVITNLNLVQKLSNLPLGLIGMAVAVPLLPLLSLDWLAGRERTFGRRVERGVTTAFVLVTPIAVFFYLHAPDLVTILFRRGAYNAHSSEVAADLLRWYSLALPAISACYLLAGSFLATGDATTPSLLKGVLHLANIVLNFELIEMLDASTIPFCYSLMYNLNLILLVIFLHRRVRTIPILAITGTAVATLAIWVASGHLSHYAISRISVEGPLALTLDGALMTGLGGMAIFGFFARTRRPENPVESPGA